jgi:hypothetical protein
MGDVRWVQCVECQQDWRYGCPECADLFADYHRTAFPGHDVTVNERLHDQWMLGIPRSIAVRQPFWMTGRADPRNRMI